MASIVGILVVFIMVFGGYVLAGGKFNVILYALPFEMMMIGGASTGAFLIANTGLVAKASLKALKVAFSKPPWEKKDYLDILVLMFNISKLIRTKGMLEMEKHLEKPEESEYFQGNDKLLKDHFILPFICDSLRLMTMNLDNPYQFEDLLDAQIEKHHHEELESSHAWQIVADGLPAIGIVAAVLGVIKTMSSIDQPPTVLGGMIGGALVGTFLGVFLSYCFVAPIANKIKAYYDEQSHLYVVIKKVIIAHLQGYAPQVSNEIGRLAIPTHEQPSFVELEEAQQAGKKV
jgi:chemotaxis protein MotA